MDLKTVGGELTLGSVYKLFVWGWAISWAILSGLVMIVVVAAGLVSGEMMVSGVMVHGRGEVLTAIWPFLALFALVLPIAIFLNALVFGGFLAFGVWIYRHWRPLRVTADCVSALTL